MSTPDSSIVLQRRPLMRLLWLTVGGLIAVHVVLTVIHYRWQELPWLVRQIFDVDEEDSFPTWYSGMALLLTAVVLGVESVRARKADDPRMWHWRGLALGFLFLSIDEIAGMHETLNSVTSFSWAIPGAVVAAGVGGIYLGFLFALPRRTAVMFVLGGAIYLGGAVGIELLTEPFLENDALDTLPYNIWTAVEEGMEMGGVLIFLNALLGHMARDGEAIWLRIDGRS